MMISDADAFEAATSLLVVLGWEKESEGPVGELWAKSKTRIPVPFSIRGKGVDWSIFLAALSAAENMSQTDLALRIERSAARRQLRTPKKVDRTELDLHLDGESVIDHETDAEPYGRFVTYASRAVTELVKDSFGVRSHPHRLQVVGGSQRGSIRVQFREPRAGIEAQPALAPAGEGAEGAALRQLGQIFNVATEAAARPNDSQLDAAVALGVDAREAIYRLADVVKEAGWSTRGFIKGAAVVEPERVRLSLAGAFRLRLATRDTNYTTDVEEHEGVVDGWQWSDGMMVFAADDRASIRAAVPAALQSAVVEQLQDPSRRARARFNVMKRHSPTGAVTRTSYALTDLEALEALDDEIVTLRMPPRAPDVITRVEPKSEERPRLPPRKNQRALPPRKKSGTPSED